MSRGRRSSVGNPKTARTSCRAPTNWSESRHGDALGQQKVTCGRRTSDTAGPALEAASSYSWTVRTWDSGDGKRHRQEVATFNTGLSNQDWDAGFGSPRHAEADDYTLARAELAVTASPITRARLYFAACHQAELYLDGKFIDRPSLATPGQGPTRPRTSRLRSYPASRSRSAPSITGTAAVRVARPASAACWCGWSSTPRTAAGKRW